MSDFELKSLPATTVRLIGSSQVITSVYSVVKELLENSLDAKATSVEIKLENFGLDRIEVRDNGEGIKTSNIPLVAKRYHTSKITSFTDLENLLTYGFRGEALGSLCAVSNVSITSKTSDEEVSQCVTFDHHGSVTSTVPSHLGQGTTVTATHLFNNMPVRRQFYNTTKKKKEELKRVEDLLMSYGAIRPGIRLSLKHGKDLVWQKNVLPDVRAALFGILGRGVMSQLEHKEIKFENSEVTMEAYFPSRSCDVHVTSRSTADRGFLAVNSRPVSLKDIDKCIRQHYCQHQSCESRYPVYFLAIDCPGSELDVNLDPNKTRVMLHHQKEIISKLTEVLEDLYGPVTKVCDSASRTEANELRNGSTDPSDLKGDDKNQSSQKETVCGPNAEKSKQSSNDNLTGCRISFYDSSKPNFEETNDTHKKLDLDTVRGTLESTNSLENKNKAVNMTDDRNCDIGLTQAGKGCFDLLDEDLDSLLLSQKTDKHNVDEVFNSNDYNTEKKLEISDVHVSKTGKELEKDILTEKESQDSGNKFTAHDLHTKDLNEILTNKDKISVSDPVGWSKGKSERQTDGQTVEPVSLLVPGQAGSNKRPPSPTLDREIHLLTPPSKKRQPVIQVDQPRIYDCVVNSDSDKYIAGFVAFSKQVRPKVVEENPSADYDTVTRTVQEKWASLSDTNKQHFCMVGKEEIQLLKKTVVEKKRLSQKIKPKATAQVKHGLPSIKDQLLACSKTPNKRSQIKTMTVQFSLSKMKHVYTTGIRESQSQLTPGLCLIGSLRFYNAWVCCHGNQFQLLNPHRVEETLLYRELLDKHVLSATAIENPVRLTESNIGGADLYETLLTLFPSPSAGQIYTTAEDERLVANGIQVRRHFRSDGSAVLDLVGLCQAMPLYGLTDLREILDQICHTKATSLSMTRPLKVINYLQSEAVRMVRQRPLKRTRDEMQDLVDQMKTSLPDNMVHCLHNKPFLHEIFDMTTIPITSSQL